MTTKRVFLSLSAALSLTLFTSTANKKLVFDKSILINGRSTMTFVDQDNQLILNDQVEKLIHEKLVADSLVSTYYEFLIFNADSILKSPLLERRISSGNMLRTSWEGMRRLTTLALVFRVSHDNKYLRRLEDEIEKIVDFSDWHPNHFLDVGEMSLGVALALNWCGQYFDENLRKKIKEKLRYHVDLTFKPGPGSGWLSKGNNWNQVCQAGIVGAALAVNDSSFVKKVVSRGVGNLSQSMKSYAPEGAFLEGPVYWGYGTVFTAFLVSMLESRFDHDFGLSKYPGFFESAAYRLMMNGTSGRVFNYSDTDPSGFGLSSREVFFFFALKTGDSLFLNKKEVLSLVRTCAVEGPPQDMHPLRFCGWYSSNQKEVQNFLYFGWLRGRIVLE